MKVDYSNQNHFAILLSLFVLVLFVNFIWSSIDNSIYKHNQKVAWEEYQKIGGFDTDPQCISRHYADSMRAISWKKDHNYGQFNQK